MTSAPTSRLFQSIYKLVREVPPGSVTTYGQLAKQVGCSARTVGFALAALPAGSDVPWQRVINSQGQVSRRQGSEGHVLQVDLLRSEGVRFDLRQRVDLSAQGWTFGSEGAETS